MKSQLPEYQNVVFKHSPLEEVVCQMRFPPILELDSGSPADFQNRILQHFPIASRVPGVQFVVEGAPVLPTHPQTWQFKSEDSHWVVSLNSSFIALKTTEYRDYHDFSSRLATVLKAFLEVYTPSYFTRVGLRYVNRFFEEVGPNGRANWSKDFNGKLVAIEGDIEIGGGIVEAHSYYVLDLEPGNLAWRISRDQGELEGTAAERLTIDFDAFSHGKINLQEVDSMLERFNSSTYRVFRWCLSDDGYQKLGPTEVENEG